MKQSIVFIHGLGLGAWIFQEHFTPYYNSQGYETHAPDLPGHTPHSSEVERKRITLDACVQFTAEYLTANISSPYVIVGMSMGGAICQRLLAQNYSHNNLRGMILLSSVPPNNNLLFTLGLCKKLALSHPQILIDFFRDYNNPQLTFAPKTLSEFSKEQVETYLQKMLTGFSYLAYEVFFQNLLTQPLSPDIPLKVIGGRDDLLFPPEVTRHTASFYSQPAHILPDLGHMIPIELNYSQGIQSMDSFLNEVF